MNNYEMAQAYLVEIGNYTKKNIPFDEMIEGYKILYHKYQHYKQQIRNPEYLENLTGLEVVLWNNRK